MLMYFFFIVNSVIFYFFFFFQAEDGIRDRTVTGVQTCAPPISPDDVRARRHRSPGADPAGLHCAAPEHRGGPRVQPGGARSEERRVGKEWRSRRAPEE